MAEEMAEVVDGGQPDAQETGTEEQGPDFGPLLERFDKLESGLPDLVGQHLDERLSPLAEALQDPEDEEQQDPYGQDQELDLYDPQQLQQWQEQQAERIREELRAEMQQQLAPVLERDLDRELGALEDQYPTLATQEGAAPVLQAARQFAEQRGIPDLARDPEFLELQYLAQVGRERAEQETPAGAQTDGVQLEQGGSAPAEPEEDSVFAQLWAQRQGNQLNWD